MLPTAGNFRATVVLLGWCDSAQCSSTLLCTHKLPCHPMGLMANSSFDASDEGTLGLGKEQPAGRSCEHCRYMLSV